MPIAQRAGVSLETLAIRITRLSHSDPGSHAPSRRRGGKDFRDVARAGAVAGIVRLVPFRPREWNIKTPKNNVYPHPRIHRARIVRRQFLARREIP